MKEEGFRTEKRYYQPEQLSNTNFPRLSKREYFAGMAMQGMIGSDNYESHSISDIATYAKDMADALISELSKEEE